MQAIALCFAVNLSAKSTASYISELQNKAQLCPFHCYVSIHAYVHRTYLDSLLFTYRRCILPFYQNQHHLKLQPNRCILCHLRTMCMYLCMYVTITIYVEVQRYICENANSIQSPAIFLSMLLYSSLTPDPPIEARWVVGYSVLPVWFSLFFADC